MKNKISKKIKKSIILGTAIGISAILIPTCVVACGAQTNTSNPPTTSTGSNNEDNNPAPAALQNIVNDAAKEVTLLKPSSVVSTTLPSTISGANLSEWFSAPKNTKTNTFTLSIFPGSQTNPNPSNYTGIINLQLTVKSTLFPGNAATTNVPFKNFLTYQEKINNVNQQVQVSTKDNVNTAYPIQITQANIGNYLNIPTKNSDYSYTYTMNNAAKTTSSGDLNVSVLVTYSNPIIDPTTFSIIKSITPKNFILTGFKQGTVSSGATINTPPTVNPSVLNEYIKNLNIVVPIGYSITQFMSAAINLGLNGTIQGNFVPSNGLIGNVLILNNQNSNWTGNNNWVTWTAKPSFSTSPTTLNNENDNTINFQMWGGNAGEGTLKIIINGFDSANQYLTPILNNQKIIANTAGAKILPSAVDSANINSLISLPNLSEVTGLKAILAPDPTVDNTNGTLNIVLQATTYGVVVQSDPITVTGFQTLKQFNAQSNVQNIANKLASFMNANVPLSTFTNQQPISFNLENIPNWFNMTTDNKNTLNGLVGSTSLSDIQVKVALPTYNSNVASDVFTSNTNSIITVTTNGISESSNLTNFQTAQNYFQTSGIVSATLAKPSQYSNITDLYKAIVAAGMSNDNETIDSNGSTTNSAGTSVKGQSIFDVSLKNNNIFNWTLSSINYVTCALADSTITLRLYIQGNVWFDVNFTANDLPKTVTPEPTPTTKPDSTPTTKPDSTPVTNPTEPKSTTNPTEPKSTTKPAESTPIISGIKE